MSASTSWIPFVDYHAGIDRRGVIHAVEFSVGMAARKSGRRTLETVCGKKRAKGYGVQSVTAEGCANGVYLMSWPPRVRTLETGQSRCRECYLRTGRPRPHSSWDRIQPSSGEVAPCGETA